MKSCPSFFRSLTFLSLLGLSAALGACSEDSSSGDGDGDGDTGGDGDGDDGPAFTFCAPAETCPPDVSALDLTTPVVSFRTDVYGTYFQSSCGGGSLCHGNAETAAAGLYLGNSDVPLTDEEVTALVTQLTTTAGAIAPGQMLVVPSDWQSSFLMAKLDGCQNDYGYTCDETSPYQASAVCDEPCGDGMPVSEGDSLNSTPFPTTPAEREKVHAVRRWIAQGAPNN